MVDEEHAFEMVHLVLEADGEQAVDLLLVRVAVSSSQRARMRSGRSTSAYWSGTDRQPSL